MNDTIEKRIDVLLERMSLRDKIGQLTQSVFVASKAEQTEQTVRTQHPGSLIIATSAHAGNDQQEQMHADVLNRMQKIAIEETGIPMIFGRDVIHGHRTVYPVPLAMAAAFEPDLVRRAYRATAKEAKNDGIHWTFTPMLDLSRDPRWGRIIESPGEDPYVGECFARAAVEGIQGQELSAPDSMVACAKHYVGYGLSEGGRDYHRAEASDYTLRNYHLKAFHAAVDAGVKTVMSSFNEISGQPVTSSRYLLTDVLKDEFGFDGFVVSDWNAVIQLKGQGVAETDADCARLAINAGLDMDMVDGCYYHHLEELVAVGEVPIAQIDDAVRRVLRVKMEAGLFEHPYIEKIDFDADSHISLARELAQESMVLLKNNGVLPLKKEQKIALFGPMARERRAHLGSWSLDFDLACVPTVEEALIEKAGAEKITTADLWDEMGGAIRRTDVTVLALGESNNITGESRGIARIELSEGQKELARRAKELGNPVVGVLCFGRPVALQDAEQYFDAILYAWHSGSQSANAIADILYGEVNPSGKTPATFARVTGQIPLYYNPSPSGRSVNGYYSEPDMFNRNYEDCLGSPLYPFGYGRSYTTYEYGTPRADRTSISLQELMEGGGVTVSVEVRNTGGMDGKEIAQCYVRDRIASMTRPVKELKGFEKQRIQAGETKTFTFRLDKSAFGFYDARGRFVIERGAFDITVGADCLCTAGVTITVE